MCAGFKTANWLEIYYVQIVKLSYYHAAAQQPEFQQAQPQELAPQAEVPPAEPTELDSVLAELPEHRRAPFVAAFNQMVDNTRHQAAMQYQAATQQAQNTAQQYEQAVAQTLLTAEAAALAPWPELAATPRDQIDAVLAHVARTDPQKHAAIRQHVSAVRALAGQQIQAAQSILQQQQAQQRFAQQEAAERFQRWAAGEDDKIDKLLASETPERRTAIVQEAATILREEGLSDQDIAHMWRNDATFRSATSQKLLMKEARARIAERGIRAARATPIPQVQRPGVSDSATLRQRVPLIQLNRRLSAIEANLKRLGK